MSLFKLSSSPIRAGERYPVLFQLSTWFCVVLMYAAHCVASGPKAEHTGWPGHSSFSITRDLQWPHITTLFLFTV